MLEDIFKPQEKKITIDDDTAIIIRETMTLDTIQVRSLLSTTAQSEDPIIFELCLAALCLVAIEKRNSEDPTKIDRMEYPKAEGLTELLGRTKMPLPVWTKVMDGFAEVNGQTIEQLGKSKAE